MAQDALLLSISNLDVTLPDSEEGMAGRRVLLSLKAILVGGAERPEDVVDKDEIIEIIRSCSGTHFQTNEDLIRRIKEQTDQIRGVASCVVSAKDVDGYADTDFVCVSTLPDPKHAVLYSIID